MINFLLIERVFYILGSFIAFILGAIKIKMILTPTNIFLKINMLFCNKKTKNKYGQEVMNLEYDCNLVNKGKDIIGELILLKEDTFETYCLGEIIILKKNIPYKTKGFRKISPAGINIKEIKTPFKAKIYFVDMKGKKHATQIVTIGEGCSGWGASNKSF